MRWAGGTVGKKGEEAMINRMPAALGTATREPMSGSRHEESGAVRHPGGKGGGS